MSENFPLGYGDGYACWGAVDKAAEVLAAEAKAAAVVVTVTVVVTVAAVLTVAGT